MVPALVPHGMSRASLVPRMGKRAITLFGEKQVAMPTYTLTYEDDGHGVEREIRFEAADPSRALTIAQFIKPGREGTLWQGGKPLCRLERRMVGEASDVWVVAGVGEPRRTTQPGAARDLERA